jgi:hypothetical protein
VPAVFVGSASLATVDQAVTVSYAEVSNQLITQNKTTAKTNTKGKRVLNFFSLSSHIRSLLFLLFHLT